VQARVGKKERRVVTGKKIQYFYPVLVRGGQAREWINGGKKAITGVSTAVGHASKTIKMVLAALKIQENKVSEILG